MREHSEFAAEKNLLRVVVFAHLQQSKLKGAVSRDFLLQVFFMDHLTLSPRIFFRWHRVVNDSGSHTYPQICTDRGDNGSKFAAGINDASGQFAVNVIVTGCAPWVTNIFAIVQKNSKLR